MSELVFFFFLHLSAALRMHYSWYSTIQYFRNVIYNKANYGFHSKYILVIEIWHVFHSNFTYMKWFTNNSSTKSSVRTCILNSIEDNTLLVFVCKALYHTHFSDGQFFAISDLIGSNCLTLKISFEFHEIICRDWGTNIRNAKCSLCFWHAVISLKVRPWWK